jgi:hypothetical protein
MFVTDKSLLFDFQNPPRRPSVKTQLKNWLLKTNKQWTTSPTIRGCVYSIGIVSCFSLFNLMAKRLDGETKFEYDNELMILLFFMYFIFAKALLWICPSVESHTTNEKPDTSEFHYYIICGAANAIGIVTSNEAVNYVGYTVLVISKASKPIPLIILCKLIADKTYKPIKYLLVLLLAIGVSLSTFKTKHPIHKSDENCPKYYSEGEILILISLAMDGLLGAVEVFEIIR